MTEHAGPTDDPPASPPRRRRHAAHRRASEPTGTYDESGLQQLGDQVHGAHRRRRGRHRKARWIVGTLAVVVIVIVGGVAGYGWYLNHEIHRIDVRGLTDVPTSGADAGTENILMVGSTDRCALTVQNAAYGLCSQGVNGVNSDVVMILHLDPSKHAVSILSIPRDLFVPNARTTGANKIDAALYQGPSQLVAAINEDLGIPIQHYVVLNFDSFANVVNALGGVKMYFPEPVYDAYSGLKQLTTGCVALDGFEALQVVRARHLQYKGPGITTDLPEFWPSENLSDLARIRRDHEFLRVLASAVAEQGLSNPVTDERLVSGVAPQLDVDKKFSSSDMVNLVLNFHSVNVDSAPQLTLPVEVDQSPSGYTYQGGAYGDVEFPSVAQDRSVIGQFLGIGGTIDTMTGKALPKPAAVSVSVLNGTGTYQQATTTSAALGALGFHMVGVGDSPPVGAESETVVYYAHKSAADQAAAQAVARSLSGSVITALGPTSDGAEVTVVTGTQFTVNPPAPVAPTTTSPAAAGATTTAPTTTTEPSSTTTTTGAFLPPTSAVTPLQPWDPRSCTPAGGEGT
ncbi:MAG TPA: LCP family protein [Acidimicrobiales bacterium]|jgi:LCP family protein required for cell wall assembly|nr:LCP family protein [Acidimicrobiales bacterium]